jgi:hypothetical protein
VSAETGARAGGGHGSGTWMQFVIKLNGVAQSDKAGNKSLRKEGFNEEAIFWEGVMAFLPGINYQLVAEQTNHNSTAIGTRIRATVVTAG